MGVEIGMMPVLLEAGKEPMSGFQVCNLTEINGGKCKTVEEYKRACRAGSILGTLQAGYTNFTYLTDVSRKIIEKEALIGVSITGWMNSPDILFDKENMIMGAQLVVMTNKELAAILGINEAARTTCAKPAGNTSVLLGTASGIHGEHAPRYFRNVQVNDQEDTLHLIQQYNPKMVEDSVWSNTGDLKVISFPIISDPNSIFKRDLLGIKQLEYVKLAQQYWVEYGTNHERCAHPDLRHNISNTITVDDWDEVEEYIYQNRQWFTGISLLSAAGDRAYPQAPFTEVFTAQQILDMYGVASMFASGVIVDALHAFNNNLWIACDTANGHGLKLDPEAKEDLLKRDWVRRAKKFAENYFRGNVMEMTNCLKDCFNLHKWQGIEHSMLPLDFASMLKSRHYTDVNTMGAQACSGNACEINI